ncbi:phosphatidylethanolamine-binding protein [Pavlovales sp. CCMP2436]|nr:phosphatidylethanolamine-binding protein [Pavlovales sp. CCMP2436]
MDGELGEGLPKPSRNGAMESLHAKLKPAAVEGLLSAWAGFGAAAEGLPALDVAFGDLPVECGARLAPGSAVSPPHVRLGNASALAIYALLMIDPDAPGPFIVHEGRAVRHWALLNIPGQALLDGEAGYEGGVVLSSYLPPKPPVGSRVHRYELLLLEQPRPLPVDLSLRTHESRCDWDVTAFVLPLRPAARSWFLCAHKDNERTIITNREAPLLDHLNLATQSADVLREWLLGVVALVAIVVATAGVLVMRLSQPLSWRSEKHRDHWPSARSSGSLFGLDHAAGESAGLALGSRRDGNARQGDLNNSLRQSLVHIPEGETEAAEEGYSYQRSARTPKRSRSLVVVGV